MVRRTELDALRGLLLLNMALTHLPTRVSAYANQPLGFVSAAEGFVFLSAFLAGASSAPLIADDLRRAQTKLKLWSRAFKLYTYHLGLLLFAFTIAAAFAATTGRPALRNLLTFYFDSPTMAVVSGPLLLYQPPLFDILPMYIVFLALTPWLLARTAVRGWGGVLFVSTLLWVFAQAGGRLLVHERVTSALGVAVPVDVTGSFDWFAWQLLWVVGLWAGARHDSRAVRASLSPAVIVAALGVGVAMLLWRHGVGGFWPDASTHGALLDKWRLGPLRLLNFAALAVVMAVAVIPLLAWLHVGVLSLLGRASLQVFCAHLLVCLASLGLVVDDDRPLTTIQEGVVIVVTMAAMVLVARRSAATAARAKSRRASAESTS